MHVVVTGASSGIGAALARELSKRGASLTLVARRVERLEVLASELEGPSRVVGWDLSDPEHAADWLADAEAALGPVDVLINNAGVQIVARTHTVDPDAADRLLRLNVSSPLRLTRAVLPGMLERRAGTIVDIASLAALAPTPAMTWYNASKAALAAASESLRGELRKTGVHVVTVYPGPVDTDMASAAVDRYGSRGAAIRRMPTGTPGELAIRVANAIERKSARVIYPRVYTVTRWFPGVTRWVMDRFSPLPE